MPLDHVLIGILAVCIAIVAYHHIAYPLLLRWLARRSAHTQPVQPAVPDADLPSFAIVVPAHNEAAVIADKIRNLAAIQYPADKLRIVLVFDGCTDATSQIASETLATLPDAQRFSVVDLHTNIGKIAVINAEIAKSSATLIALTDTSATCAPDALLRAARHFADPQIGVVCATYRLQKAGSEGERVYWEYQTRIKLREAALAAPIGAHGAFYMLRRSLWQPLPSDTINDDFFIPMRIVLAGNRSIYDPGIVATELEQSTRKMEFRRRVRIGAGNMQQLVRMPQLLNPMRGALAFLFVSGKGLRALIPFFLLLGALCGLLLLLRSSNPLLHVFLAAAAIGGTGVLAARARQRGSPAALEWLGYFIEGHFASGLGGLIYLTQRRSGATTSWANLYRFVGPLPISVAVFKRLSDLVLGGLMLIALAGVLMPIAIASRRAGRGPIFQSELCVGTRRNGSTRHFSRYAFRLACKEPTPGANRALDLSSMGAWLRTTRLDILPQCINVLRGDMAIVGPRARSPDVVAQIERSAPAQWERISGLRPGITGLAQINRLSLTASDRDQRELQDDHTYCLQLSSFATWLKADVTVLWRSLLALRP